MKPLTREWIAKAEGDWTTANREMRSRKNPNYDAVCFHAQQCMEKYMKAILQERDIAFEKSHNLTYLLELLLPSHPLWEGFRVSLAQISNYAVSFRYPGESADRETSRVAINLTKGLRRDFRSDLGLKKD
jgi:HEPN domain-containing protein